MLGIVTKHEVGATRADLCHKHGLSVSDSKRRKALAHENAKLKKHLAEQMQDLAALKELLSKMAGPAVNREAVARLVAHLQAKQGLSEWIAR
jgi:putative transposase